MKFLHAMSFEVIIARLSEDHRVTIEFIPSIEKYYVKVMDYKDYHEYVGIHGDIKLAALQAYDKLKEGK